MKFMKIGLAVCKCDINFNDNITTFMFAEMSIRATFHHSVFSAQDLLFVYKYWITFVFSLSQSDYFQRILWYSFHRIHHTGVSKIIFASANFCSNDAKVNSTDENHSHIEHVFFLF